MPEPDLSVSPRAIWKLTWPQMLMMYLVFFMGFINIWVAGRISADVQAALGMVNQCGLFLMVVAMSMSSGATAAVSQSLGAKRMRRAQRYVGTTALGSLLAGILVALLGWQLGSPILRVLQVPERILPVTAGFWDITMLALPAQYVYAATGVMFRATRQVLPPLWVAATVCVFDLLGCLGLGLGWFGLPCMGYMGIAWANAGAESSGSRGQLFAALPGRLPVPPGHAHHSLAAGPVCPTCSKWPCPRARPRSSGSPATSCFSSWWPPCLSTASTLWRASPPVCASRPCPSCRAWPST